MTRNRPPFDLVIPSGNSPLSLGYKTYLRYPGQVGTTGEKQMETTAEKLKSLGLTAEEAKNLEGCLHPSTMQKVVDGLVVVGAACGLVLAGVAVYKHFSE